MPRADLRHNILALLTEEPYFRSPAFPHRLLRPVSVPHSKERDSPQSAGRGRACQKPAASQSFPKTRAPEPSRTHRSTQAGWGCKGSSGKPRLLGERSARPSEHGGMPPLSDSQIVTKSPSIDTVAPDVAAGVDILTSRQRRGSLLLSSDPRGICSQSGRTIRLGAAEALTARSRLEVAQRKSARLSRPLTRQGAGSARPLKRPRSPLASSQVRSSASKISRPSAAHLLLRRTRKARDLQADPGLGEAIASSCQARLERGERRRKARRGSHFEPSQVEVVSNHALCNRGAIAQIPRDGGNFSSFAKVPRSPAFGADEGELSREDKDIGLHSPLTVKINQSSDEGVPQRHVRAELSHVKRVAVATNRDTSAGPMNCMAPNVDEGAGAHNHVGSFPSADRFNHDQQGCADYEDETGGAVDALERDSGPSWKASAEESKDATVPCSRLVALELREMQKAKKKMIANMDECFEKSPGCSPRKVQEAICSCIERMFSCSRDDNVLQCDPASSSLPTHRGDCQRTNCVGKRFSGVTSEPATSFRSQGCDALPQQRLDGQAMPHGLCQDMISCEQCETVEQAPSWCRVAGKKTGTRRDRFCSDGFLQERVITNNSSSACRFYSGPPGLQAQVGGGPSASKNRPESNTGKLEHEGGSSSISPAVCEEKGEVVSRRRRSLRLAAGTQDSRTVIDLTEGEDSEESGLEISLNDVVVTDSGCSKAMRMFAEQSDAELKLPLSRRPRHAFLTALSEEEGEVVKHLFTGRNDDEKMAKIAKARITLTRGDFKRLRGARWLNDELINAYVALLNARNDEIFLEVPDEQRRSLPRTYMFNTFFHTRLTSNGQSYDYNGVARWTSRAGIDVRTYDQILVPVNLGNHHWVLAAVDVATRTFRYLDSMRGRKVLQVLEPLMWWLRDELSAKYGECVDISKWKVSKNVYRIRQPSTMREEGFSEFVEREAHMPQQRDGGSCGVFMAKAADCLSLGIKIYFTQADISLVRRRMALELCRGYLSL